MLPETSNLRSAIVKVSVFLLFDLFLSFNKDLLPIVCIIILLWCLKRNGAFLSDWACFLYKLAILLLKFVWSVYYWIGGIWIFHGIYKGIVWIAEEQRKEAARWDVREVGGIRTRYNRETGQTIEEEINPIHQRQQPAFFNSPQEQHQRPSDQRRRDQLIIKSWLHCTILDHQNTHITRRPNGSRLVAHVDTGNAAHTAISKQCFDRLFPGGQGAVQEGFQLIQGVTGVARLCPVVRIRYQLDGVVGPSLRNLQVDVQAIILEPYSISDRLMSFFGVEEDHDILISTHDMEVFFNQYGYAIQPISRKDFLFGRA